MNNQTVGAEVDRFIADALAPEEKLPAERGEWQIDSYRSAEWAIATADYALAQIAKSDAALKEAIPRFQESAAKAKAPHESTIEFMHHALEPWVRKELDGKRKSMIVAGKRLGFRKLPDSLEIVDEGAAKAWAKEHLPEAVQVVTTEKLLKAPLKEVLTKQGIVPDGVRLNQGEERFYKEDAV
jgi:hypothetical protein